MKYFKAIAAMAENRVIGQGNQIPWHLPADFKWFKQQTTGQVVIMGRRTFESIGRPLPNRETIILSRRGFSYPGIRVVGSLAELDPSTEARQMFICGGAQIYEQALPHCDELFLTLVKLFVSGDVLFPAFEEKFEVVRELQDGPEFKIIQYRNTGLAA